MGDPIPANLEPYVAVLGEELAITFFLKFGGASAYLSENPRAGSDLSQVIGTEKVKALAETLGVGHLYRVPINRRWLARALKARGYSVLSIARELHVSDVTIRSYLKDEDKRQLSFFDQD
jgi:hypothetical protein